MKNLTNLPNWNNIPLQEILSREFNYPIFIENDVLIVSLGEPTLGSINDTDFLYKEKNIHLYMSNLEDNAGLYGGFILIQQKTLSENPQ